MPCLAATSLARWAYFVRLLFWLRLFTGQLDALRSQRLLSLRGRLSRLQPEVGEEDGNRGTSASSTSSARTRPPPRRTKVLPALSKLNRSELLALAERYNITPPDPKAMTVQQLVNYLYDKDEELEATDNLANKMVDFGQHKDQMTYEQLVHNEPEYCEWCLTLRDPSVKMRRLRVYLQQIRLGTHGARSGPTETKPTRGPEAAPTADTSGTPAVRRTRPAPDDGGPASRDTSRSPSSAWEALGQPSPTDYLASIDTLFRHVTTRMRAMPQTSQTANRLIITLQEQRVREVTNLTTDPGQLEEWMASDPLSAQILALGLAAYSNQR